MGGCMSDVDAVLRTMNLIRNYLDLHPEAADTVAGVRCWLQTFGYGHEKIDVVQCALDLLVARGEITCEPLPGGKGYYRRQCIRGDE
jgi:hypothetical protein